MDEYIDTPQEPFECPPRSELTAEATVKRPTWATVIGVVAIIIGVMGAVGYGACTPIGTLMSSVMRKQMPPDAAEQPALAPTVAQLDVATQYAPLNIANGCMIALLGVVLFIGGIGLIRMRRWARATMLWWAVLRLLYIAPSSYISWLVQQRTFDAMIEAEQRAGSATQGGATFASIFGSPMWAITFVIIGAIFAMVLPVFALIWFNRASIRESMDRWT